MSVRPRFTYPSNDTFDFDEHLLDSGLHNPVVQLGVLRSCSTTSRPSSTRPDPSVRYKSFDALCSFPRVFPEPSEDRYSSPDESENPQSAATYNG